MNIRIVILTASSLIFCTGNAMNPQDQKVGTKEDKKLAKYLALLPSENSPAQSSSSVSPKVDSPVTDQELIHMVHALYRAEHFAHLAKLKQRREKF